MNKLRKPIIAGNWKMNGTRASIKSLIEQISNDLISPLKAEVMVFPPFVYLDQVAQLVKNTELRWGAQNAAAEAQGAFTGEISALMLKDIGCQYVLVGHSERRHLFGESNETVVKKFDRAIQAGLTPILCVGETLDQRKQGKTEAVVGDQLQAVLSAKDGVNSLENVIIAYEPVWAIGTGLTATPEQAEEIHSFLREQLKNFSSTLSQKVRILYGGSVKANNASALFSMPNIDGGLIGGASLDAKEFLQIYHAVEC